MTKKLIVLAILLLSFSRAFCLTLPPVDSIGIETKGNKTFVLHRVDQKQTLTAILKKYHCTKAEFFEVNPYLNGNPKMNFDQIVRIPVAPRAKLAKIKTTASPSQKVSSNPEVTYSKDTTPIEINQPEKVVIIDSETQKVTQENINQSTTGEAERIVRTKPLKHKVTQRTETLYGIAHQYHVSAKNLREWNKLKSDFVQLGQSLVVEDPITYGIINTKKTAKIDTSVTKLTKSVAQKPKKDSMISLKAATKKMKRDSVLAMKAPVKVPVQGPAADVEKVKPAPKTETKPVVAATPTYIPNAPGVKKTIENGVAEVIDAGEKSDKYLALHKTAPVGTLIQVRNESNGLSVWVKVIGKLPDTGETIIKISPKAFEKLQPRDKRIRAEISYVK